MAIQLKQKGRTVRQHIVPRECLRWRLLSAVCSEWHDGSLKLGQQMSSVTISSMHDAGSFNVPSGRFDDAASIIVRAGDASSRRVGLHIQTFADADF